MSKHVLIIGAGPAGVAAALTLRMRNIDATVLHSGPSALSKAQRVDNYPGLPRMSGSEMESIFRRQCEEAGVAFHRGLARLIQKTRKGFMVLVGEDILSADAVLLCTGVGRLGLLEGEEALIGQGVSYCATCDGMLYRGGSVAVIAQDASYEEDVQFLRGICHVDYYLERKHAAPEGIVPCEGKPVRLAHTDDHRVLLATDRGENTYDCVFILRPAVALSQLLPALETKDGAICVDEGMRTNIPGVFAAGDVTGKPYQLARAAGQGNVAALAIASYLADTEK